MISSVFLGPRPTHGPHVRGMSPFFQPRSSPSPGTYSDGKPIRHRCFYGVAVSPARRVPSSPQLAHASVSQVPPALERDVYVLLLTLARAVLVPAGSHSAPLTLPGFGAAQRTRLSTFSCTGSHRAVSACAADLNTSHLTDPNAVGHSAHNPTDRATRRYTQLGPRWHACAVGYMRMGGLRSAPHRFVRAQVLNSVCTGRAEIS